MEIKVDINNQNVELHIESDWESVKDNYENILEEYAKTPIKGFRPGKTPQKIIEQRFGSKIIKEVGVQSSQNLCKIAMAKKEMVAGSPISISNVKLQKQQSIQFIAEFILMPEFELPEYLDLKLESNDEDEKRDKISEILLVKTEIDIPDEMVEQEMELTGITTDKSDTENWEAAKNRVALLLILRQIAEQDGIEVDDRDVEERIGLVAQQNGTTASALKQMLLPSGGLSRLSNYLTAEKVLEYIIENN